MLVELTEEEFALITEHRKKKKSNIELVKACAYLVYDMTGEHCALLNQGIGLESRCVLDYGHTCSFYKEN